MASQYPAGLDSLATNKNNSTPTANDHAAHHNDLADAVNKIEAELGINPSGSYSNLVGRLNSGSLPTNPLDYNAVGDGATDDSGALNTAIPAAKHLHLPYGATGIYEIGATLQLTSNLRITADPGVKIRRKAGFTGNLIADTGALTNVYLEEVTIDNRSQTGDTTGTAGNVAIFTNGATGLNVLGCKFPNLGDALALMAKPGVLNNADITIEECELNGPFGSWSAGTALNAAIYIANPIRANIHRNKLLGCGQIQLPMSTGAAASRGVYIRHNEFDGIDATCIIIRPDPTGNSIEVIDVSHNEARDIGLTRGKGLVSINDTGGGTVRTVSVKDNQIRRHGALTSAIVGGSGADRSSGIQVGGASTSPASICEGVEVNGNTIDARNTSGVIEDRENAGIRLYQCDGFTIEDNTCIGHGLSGIFVIGATTAYTCRNGVIVGNRVEQAMQMATTDAGAAINLNAGIYISGPGCEEMTVEANHVFNCGNTSSAGAGAVDLAGIAVGASSTFPARNIRFYNNRATDNRGTKYQAYGLRIGDPGSGDGSQPTPVTWRGNELGGNLTAALKRYNTTPKVHRAYDNVGGGNLAVRLIVPLIASPQAAVTWSLPNTLTEFLALTTTRRKIDLSAFDEVRLVGNTPGLDGTVGAALVARYSTDGGTNWNYLDNSAGPSIDVNAATGNPRTGAWVTLADAAKTDVIIALWGQGGSGGAGLSIRIVELELR
jgi:hypothetical protein